MTLGAVGVGVIAFTSSGVGGAKGMFCGGMMVAEVGVAGVVSLITGGGAG